MGTSADINILVCLVGTGLAVVCAYLLDVVLRRRHRDAMPADPVVHQKTS